jgi:hypothetical protein
MADLLIQTLRASVVQIHLSRFRVRMAIVRQASLVRANLSFGFELIDRDHQQNFGKSEIAERVLRDLEHNRRDRDSHTGHCRCHASLLCR